MSNIKKLGKGLDEISYLFLSSPEENSSLQDELRQPQKISPSVMATPLKSICLIGDNHGFQNAFLVINLSLALARLGMRIAIVDMDEELFCLNFFLGKERESLVINVPEGVIQEGPLGVKLISLNKSILDKLSKQGQKERFVAQLSNIETDVDLILVSVLRKNIQGIVAALSVSVKEFLMLVPPDKEKMMDAYKVIKKIYGYNKIAKIGIVVTDIEHMYEIDAVFDKMSAVGRKFLDKELYKYGFLFKLKPEADVKNQIASFYDADITACISNIAQIVVLRSSLGEATLSPGPFFEKIISDLNQNK